MGRWQRTCLNPRFSLRTQMFLSFGLTSVIAICCFVGIGLYTADNSGGQIRREVNREVTDLVKHALSSTALYLAQTITKKFNNIGAAGSLIAEATRDRIVGYPYVEGWDELDAHVPFRDSITGLNKYPLDGPPLPLEWAIVNNVNAENAQEHFLDRQLYWYTPESTNISTVLPSYYMQGMCNPSIQDPSHPAYYPNCTEANNNLRTGGVVQPTIDTNYYLANKSKDLAWVFKPLFESHGDIKQVGMFYANDGAGSVVQYPAQVYNNQDTYTSIGCDWMLERIHPRLNKTIATPQQVRRCHPAGTVVPMREYNPLERGWCRNQVMREMDLAEGKASYAGDNVVSTGPYKDALTSETLWVLTFGQAVYDRMTDEFIGCALIDVFVESLYDILRQSIGVGVSSQAALIQWDDDGTVIVASDWSPQRQNETAVLTDLSLGIDATTYANIRDLVNFSSPDWTSDEVYQLYEETYFMNSDRSKWIMVHPVPNVPRSREDDPNYKPEYLVILSIDRDEAFALVDEMEETIDYDVTESWKRIGMVGGVGLGVVLLSISYIASTLTKPLRWMQKVAGRIIDNAGGQDLRKGLTEEMDSSDAHPMCSPRTEVTYLLLEFEKMINGFSGEGAAEVAGLQVNEVQNRFTWRRLYESVYPWETDPRNAPHQPHHNGGPRLKGDPAIPRQLSITKTASHDTFEDELTTESTMNTGHTRESALSSLASTIISHPTVSTALSRVTPMINQARTYAIKYKLISEPPPEVIKGPPMLNFGPNIVIPPDPMQDYFDAVENPQTSFLFWYTTLLVGAPILATAILISVFAAQETQDNIPKWLEEVKIQSVEIERNTINTAAVARTLFGQEVVSRVFRDLHLYSRVAGWLLFGGLLRAQSFTWTKTGADECKYYDNRTNAAETCPYALNETLSPCACNWNDPRDGNCTSYNSSMESRELQARFYEGQSDDIDPRTGARFGTFYDPRENLTIYPTNISWWNDTVKMPGYGDEGLYAAGYETTYDRVRVLSAMAVVEFPVYNYNPGVGEEKSLASYVALEADGMMTGFQGCGNSHATGWPFWKATWENRAEHDEAQYLCPVGKYGYDPRCRDWYAKGEEVDTVHVTPPYEFAGSGRAAATATFSLVDPNAIEPRLAHVGQASLDFLPASFLDAMRRTNTAIGHTDDGGFPIVITPEEDQLGFNTLIGPGFDHQGGAGKAIGDLVLPVDGEESEYRLIFEEKVVKRMQAGEEGNVTFTRTNRQTLQPEVVYLTFSPLKLRTLIPNNHSDFSRGVRSNTQLVYSVGLGITEEDLENPFRQVRSDVNRGIGRVKYISTACIVAAMLVVIYLTYTMCLYISSPIVVLIGIVKSIEDKTLQDDLPPLAGGSSEIYAVYDSLEKLCKIVRFSNAAFFKGDRAKSYRVLEDALELFVKMGNQKALGVANNNLGTMVLQEQMERSSSTKRSDEVYFAGMKYFEEAIRIGTFEYQNSPEDDTKGDFIKQLANRYFNRGMFYIVNRKHPMASKNLEETGVKDIVRAKALDEEANSYWKERGQLPKQARKEFGCLLRRARGMLTLVNDAEFRDIWGIESLIQEAEAMLKNPEFAQSKLFENISMVARRQQVNDLKIQYELSRDDTEAAAKIAMKMLVEDEYIIDTVLMNAITTINKHFDLHGQDMAVPNMAQYVKRETRRGQVDSMRAAKNVIFCLDYSGSMAGERMARAQKNLLWTYEEHCLDKDFVGFVRFNHSVDDKLFFDLQRKGGNQEEHMEVLTAATDAEGGTRLYAAFNRCVNMTLSSGNQYDTWIIALTDGESAWDFPAKSVIERIDKHNKKNESKIHVIVIGFEVSSDVAESVAQITSITDKSMYIDARGGLDKMDTAFEQVASVISGTAITMETF